MDHTDVTAQKTIWTGIDAEISYFSYGEDKRRLE
jgi:hypothetical protein